MPHISPKKIDSKILEKIFSEFAKILERAGKAENLNSLTNELFTNTEKIMFAKRIAIILMLQKSVPQDKISEILKVSPTTISKFSLKIQIGKYKALIEISQKNKIDLEKVVWSILTVGGLMRSKIGSRYWKNYSKK